MNENEEKNIKVEEVNEDKAEEVSKEKNDEVNVVFDILRTGKWKKDQTISVFDLSSIDGILNTLFKVLTVLLLVRLLKGKKKK